MNDSSTARKPITATRRHATPNGDDEGRTTRHATVAAAIAAIRREGRTDPTLWQATFGDPENDGNDDEGVARDPEVANNRWLRF